MTVASGRFQDRDGRSYALRVCNSQGRSQILRGEGDCIDIGCRWRGGRCGSVGPFVVRGGSERANLLAILINYY